MEIKFFKKEKSFKKDKESLWLNMNLYWNGAVCLIFIVVILSFFLGYYLFMQINKEPMRETTNNSPQIQTIKKERINKALQYFSTKEQKSNQILNSPAPVIDPSL